MLASTLLGLLSCSTLALPVTAEQRGVGSAATLAPRSAQSSLALAELVRAATAADHAAFAELYQRFARAVHAVVLTKVAAQDAGDIVQEVFATVYRQLARLEDPNAFPGWIIVIARRRAIDHLRQRNVRPEASADPDDIAANVGAQDAAIDTARALAAIRSLPEAYAETLMMRLVEGLTGPEIAERTGLAPGSVRVNLCRGMALLRNALADGGAR